MAVNYAHLLKKPVDSVKRPPLKPSGTYHGTIQGYKFDESKQQKTPFVRFLINNVSAGEDVAPDDLYVVDADTQQREPIDLSKWTPHKDFFITDDALFILREFLESCKIPVKGRGFDETIPEVKGMPVIFTCIQGTSQDGQRMFNSIGELKGA